ncbi:MAG: HEAT repeat domain-containing protein [Planctomycetota bacterium]
MTVKKATKKAIPIESSLTISGPVAFDDGETTAMPAGHVHAVKSGLGFCVALRGDTVAEAEDCTETLVAEPGSGSGPGDTLPAQTRPTATLVARRGPTGKLVGQTGPTGTLVAQAGPGDTLVASQTLVGGAPRAALGARIESADEESSSAPSVKDQAKLRGLGRWWDPGAPELASSSPAPPSATELPEAGEVPTLGPDSFASEQARQVADLETAKLAALRAVRERDRRARVRHQVWIVGTCVLAVIVGYVIARRKAPELQGSQRAAKIETDLSGWVTQPPVLGAKSWPSLEAEGARSATRTVSTPGLSVKERREAARTVGRAGLEAVPTLVRVAIDDTDPKVREVAVDTLSLIRRRDGADLLGPLLEEISLLQRDPNLNDGYRAGRMDRVAMALGAAGPPALPTLQQFLDGEPSDRRILVLVGALGRVGEEALPLLTELLRDPAPPVRAEVCVALGRVGSFYAIDSLIDRLQRDPEAVVRTNAYWALKTLTGQPLPGSGSRWAAWWANGPGETYRELDDLIDLLASGSANEQVAVLRRLAPLRERRVILAAARCLIDWEAGRTKVRLEAARTLRAYEATAGLAIESLIQALADEEPVVREVVHSSLRAITQEGHSSEVGLWIEWWDTINALEAYERFGVASW